MMQTDSGLSRSLSFLLQGLCGAEIPVQFMAAPDNTNPEIGLRPIISAQSFLLPHSSSDFTSARSSALERASVAHAAAHLLYSTPAREVTRLKPMGVAVVSAIEDARVELLLIKRLPGIRRWFCQAIQEEMSAEHSAFSLLIAKLSYGLLNEHAQVDDYWVNKARDLFFTQAAQSGLEDYECFRAIASILANDLGQMRIQFNPQAYINPVSYRDDNSYLWNFSSQQSEHDLSINLPQSESMPRSLMENSGDIPPSVMVDIQTHHYPEWDYRSEIERKDWCTILEFKQNLPVTSRHEDVYRRNTQKHLRIYKQNTSALSREKLFRQQEGDLLDMNAIVDSVALARQGGLGDERHYIRHTLRQKSVSLLLMLDLSASVGNAIDDQSPSILELERRAAIMLADYAIVQGDRIAIHGFCSDKRSGVHYHRYLDFDRPFSMPGLHALQNAAPQYSTRMGAALRHGVQFFNGADTDARAIIMITDGAPSDIDVFDPQYLVEDARRVVMDAAKNRIDIYGLVLDPSAAQQTKKIFGSARHRIVTRAQSLSIYLESLYRQIRS